MADPNCYHRRFPNGESPERQGWVYMHNERHRDRGAAGIRIVGLPGGWFGKALALALAVVLGVLALSFSLAILVLVFVAGSAIWIYFIVRRALSGASVSKPGGQEPQAASSDAGGRVIEGEVIRDEDERPRA